MNFEFEWIKKYLGEGPTVDRNVKRSVEAAATLEIYHFRFKNSLSKNSVSKLKKCRSAYGSCVLFAIA